MNRNLQSFIIAWLVIIGISAVFIIAMQVAVKLSPETEELPKEKTYKVKLPSDIPLYEGAQLAKAAKSTSGNSERFIFRYFIPLASVSSVKSFYEDEMKSGGWRLFIQSADSCDFYKENGQRQVKMDFHSEAGRVVLIIETSSKKQ